MKIFSSLLLISGICAGLLACTKDSTPDPTPASSNMTNLTASTWLYENAGVDADKNGTIDLPLTATEVPPCLADNKLTFKSDNTAIADEGATKCNTSNPQTSTFNWNFSNNEKVLNISSPVFAVFSGNLNILTLNSTKLTLGRDTVISTIPMQIIVNLKH
jgi:hypothetical protein